MSEAVSFGMWLRQARKARDLTQEELEQQIFLRLAVFVNGCTLAAAETLWAAELEGADLMMVDVLQSLVDKSLVLQVADPNTPDAEPRFTMLETIRT